MPDAVAKLFGAQPASYEPHALHAPDRAFRESNCYADLWVAILHGLGLEPHASLAYTLDVLFEGDQFTFYKPRHTELEALYGIRVDELCLWGSVLDHCAVQVERRRMPLVEVDAFFLPDTRGTDYRTNHVKTTIGIVSLDRQARRMVYFHNAGLYGLEGDDFEGLFHLAAGRAPGALLPYAELTSFERLVHREPAELRVLAEQQAAAHVARLPQGNPLEAYAAEVDGQLETCIGQGTEAYHHYIFASIRQLGSAADFASLFLAWLDAGRFPAAVTSFREISDTSKMLILKTARMAHRGRPGSVREPVESMARAWQTATAELSRELSPAP